MATLHSFTKSYVVNLRKQQHKKSISWEFYFHCFSSPDLAQILLHIHAVLGPDLLHPAVVPGPLLAGIDHVLLDVTERRHVTVTEEAAIERIRDIL